MFVFNKNMVIKMIFKKFIVLLIICISSLLIGCVDTIDNNISNELYILNVSYDIKNNIDYISIRFINNNNDIKYINNYDDKYSVNLKVSKDECFHLYPSKTLFVYYDVYIPVNNTYYNE